jgi:hypothetical protein
MNIDVWKTATGSVFAVGAYPVEGNPSIDSLEILVKNLACHF